MLFLVGGVIRIELMTSTMSMQGSALKQYFLHRLINDNPITTNELQGTIEQRVEIIPCFIRATAKCFPYVQWDILVQGSVV